MLVYAYDIAYYLILKESVGIVLIIEVDSTMNI